MMKKFLLPFFVLMAFTSYSQLNNSWIDFSKTYYKFRISKDTLCRITQPVLASIGLGNIPAEQFQLWRNGQQVRLYTTVAAGAMGGSDFIEFWGQMNDGKPDKNLYRDADYQLGDKYSLFTDTASYFLTVNAAGGNLRYTNGPVLSAGAMVPDPYFMRRIEYQYNYLINRGYAAVVGDYVFSSSYDSGEGWTSDDTQPCCDQTKEFQNMNVYTAGPADGVSFTIAATGNALNGRNLRVKLFQNTIVDTAMPYFNYVKISRTGLPLSLLQSPDYLPIYMNGTSSNPNDRIVVSNISLTYPAKFVFNNEKNFYFELAPSATGNYLIIDNFNNSGSAPVLYDFTSNQRYIGDISTAGKVKFVLPAFTASVRKLMLSNYTSGNINPIVASNISTKTFTNFANAANQGDYLIISNPVLYNDGNGVNNVDLYRQYRASASGGGYNPKIIPIAELIDQFGFGIKQHPTAIRDFIRFANQNFTVKPKYVFLIGRGLSYMDYRANETQPASEKIDLVPTFGWPASDVLLACDPGSNVPTVSIGRLAAINGTEVGYYLDKMKQYEQAQASTSQTVTDKAWMKNFMHVAGGKDDLESLQFQVYLDGYKAIIEDTLYGAHVETFVKTSTAAVQQVQSQRIDELYTEGLSFIQYFGHSSASTLEFNLSSPETYNNQGKYPFFSVSGCAAGNFFLYDPLRLTGNLTLSEKYVLAPQRGSIAFLASTHLGIPPFLDFYNTDFYLNFGRKMYGNTVGNQIRDALQQLGGNPATLDYYTRIHLEELNLHGDPAVKINNFAAPDYIIEDKLVKISPNIISVADSSFSVAIKMMNIGRAIGDSIRVTVKRKLPNDTIRVLYNQIIPSIKYMDSINLIVPINPATDKGANQLIVQLDVDNRISELSETNNILVKDFFIFEDELRPVYPYNYSIVNQQNISYIGSTANPLSGLRQYVMEIDTTENFNSTFKKVYSSSGTGGIVQFTPANLTFGDSTVYYWRTAMVPLNNGAYIWNNSSFIYLNGGSTGFNQSHYFQHQKSSFNKIRLDSADRKFKFNSFPRTLTVRNGNYPTYSFDDNNINLDFDRLELWGCLFSTVQVYIFDPATLVPWENYPVNNGTEGRFKSNVPCSNGVTDHRKFFEFAQSDPINRKRLINFLQDSIPSGMYVVLRNLDSWQYSANTTFVQDWKNDTLALGSGKSLYHTFKNIGFNQIDSYYHQIPYVFFYQKNTPSFTPKQFVGADSISYLDVSIPLISTYVNGTIESPVFGPAKKWNAFHWRSSSPDATLADSTVIEIYGVQNNGNSVLLRTVAPALDTTLSFVNAATYPYLKLRMVTKDSIYATPPQLRYWRINADYVPEGALAPNISYKMKDTVDQGETIDFAIAFKNISQTAFDSLLRVKFYITDRNNLRHDVIFAKRKALVIGDTLMVSYTIDSKIYPGNNTLFLEINPDNDQPEQYHFNNILYKSFYVREDKFDPLLDVTFDAVHILNRDIVASKPHILIKLKDESRFLALTDTSLLKVQVMFPDGSLHNYRFGDSLKFTPANVSSGTNTATIDFLPFFGDDGEYKLIVSGKDVVGNKTGDLEYQVVFTVINKPMISNMLNYPNPFTTSTAFVFTITGSDVPQNIRIQVLTITGKVVREITKDELGPLHIGRNITDFKWDGTDMYGQKLANGVYIYRVITNLNGKSLDKYKAEGDNTDKYFTKGYGKMYLMR
ncbi:MAG: C25 family cysteine peptidase [Ferruginibacter sp.]